MTEERHTGGREGVLLLKVWDDGEAAMIRQLLDSYGIPCQVVSDVPHTVLPISVDGLGEVRILVPPSRLEEARAILADHRRQGADLSASEADRSDGKGDDGERSDPGGVGIPDDLGFCAVPG